MHVLNVYYSYCSAFNCSEPPSVSTLALELYEISEKWKKLAVKLELTREEIRGIQEEHPTYSDRCLIGVLNTWHKKKAKLSWSDVIRVLNSREISEPGIATRIMREYC